MKHMERARKLAVKVLDDTYDKKLTQFKAAKFLAKYYASKADELGHVDIEEFNAMVAADKARDYGEA